MVNYWMPQKFYIFHDSRIRIKSDRYLLIYDKKSSYKSEYNGALKNISNLSNTTTALIFICNE